MVFSQLAVVEHIAIRVFRGYFALKAVRFKEQFDTHPGYSNGLFTHG
jgi:hypothetical protein